MVNKNKNKGTDWERQIVKILAEKIKNSEWKRVVGSGAIGTAMGEPLLMGDVTGSIENFYKKIRGECKAGYGGSKQFALKKEWLDKIKIEAKNINAFPVLFGKFSDSRSGSRHFVVVDLDDFIELINEYIELKEDLDKLFVYIEESKRNGNNMGSD